MRHPDDTANLSRHGTMPDTAPQAQICARRSIKPGRYPASRRKAAALPRADPRNFSHPPKLAEIPMV
jgi:hypothetical protein